MLKDVTFRPGSLNIEWITMALRTITPENGDLRQISIDVPAIYAFDDGLRKAVEEPVRGQWSDLDRLLVQFWESYSICFSVMRAEPRFTGMRDRVVFLLPELTRKGIIDLTGL